MRVGRFIIAVGRSLASFAGKTLTGRLDNLASRQETLPAVMLTLGLETLPAGGYLRSTDQETSPSSKNPADGRKPLRAEVHSCRGPLTYGQKSCLCHRNSCLWAVIVACGKTTGKRCQETLLAAANLCCRREVSPIAEIFSAGRNSPEDKHSCQQAEKFLASRQDRPLLYAKAEPVDKACLCRGQECSCLQERLIYPTGRADCAWWDWPACGQGGPYLMEICECQHASLPSTKRSLHMLLAGLPWTWAELPLLTGITISRVICGHHSHLQPQKTFQP